MNTKIRASIAAAAIATTLFSPSMAEANEADRITAGSCSGAAEWKFKLSREHGGIEVEYEVDASRRGQQWRVALFHGHRRFARNVFTTHGPSGSFTVRRVESNRAGVDRFRARAVRLGDGQTCRGRARF